MKEHTPLNAKTLLCLPAMILLVAIAGCHNPTQYTTNSPQPITLIPTLTPFVAYTVQLTQAAPTRPATSAEITASPGLPTLTPATPMASPDKYQLRDGTEQDALANVELMWVYWQWFEHNQAGYHGYTANGVQKYIAVAVQEARLRFPTLDEAEALEWEIAYALAKAGDQLASEWLARLIERSLNEGSIAIEQLHAWNKLQAFHRYDEPEVMEAYNLFADSRDAYVLRVGELDGVAFSIAPSASGTYVVRPIASFWLTAHRTGFRVVVGDHNHNGVPEVAVSHSFQAGSGPSFGLTALHIYEWHNNTWVDLTGPGIYEPNSFADWHYALGVRGQAAQVVFATLPNVEQWPFCTWKMTHIFGWDGRRYTLQLSEIEVPKQLRSPVEVMCFQDVWDWAITAKVYSPTIVLMEHTLKNWPSPETDLGMPFSTFEEKFGPAYRVFFEFQLGRFYALAGNPKQAQMVLNRIVSLPADTHNARYLAIAQMYLEHLAQVEVAEQFLIDRFGFNEGLSLDYLTSGLDMPLPLVPDIASIEKSIFLDEDIPTAVQQINAALPHCQRKEYEPYDCGRLHYFLGLAHELSGNEQDAVKAYWQLWQQYPDSLYTVMARQRLKSTTP